MKLAELPERPASEVEWEDLLVRLEIVPRALRMAVDDAGGDSAELRSVLAQAVGREAWWGDRLGDLREGRGFYPQAGFGPVTIDGREATAGELVEAFTRLRNENFAQVQRRGLGVWGWRSVLDDGSGSMTAYQALQLMARMDGALLAALRATGRGNG